MKGFIVSQSRLAVDIVSTVQCWIQSGIGTRCAHWLQVLHSVQQALALGEVFSGDDSPQLRAILAANASSAFQTLIAADLATLCQVLAQEPWRRAALSEGGEKMGDHCPDVGMCIDDT